MGYRISIGPAQCRGVHFDSPIKQAAGEEILARLDHLSKTAPEQLRALPATREERLCILDRDVFITTFRDEKTSGELLIVVSAFIPTFWFPTYLSLDGVGHILAEGIVVGTDDTICAAPDEDLWEYR